MSNISYDRSAGQLSSDKDAYLLNDMIRLMIEDQDGNLNPENPDTIDFSEVELNNALEMLSNPCLAIQTPLLPVVFITAYNS